MENKKLNRVFDQVKLSRAREDAILADLLRDKKEVSNMKQTNRRRIPTVAFVAAVLAVALMGTAVAALSRVRVEPYGDGYSVWVNSTSVPMDSLSEDIVERAASGKRIELLPFDSWDEAEAYLGIEIADNARLDQMRKDRCGDNVGEGMVEAPCIINMLTYEGLPDIIEVRAQYREGRNDVHIDAALVVDNQVLNPDRSFGYANTVVKRIGTESYVTPSGLETTIITSRWGEQGSAGADIEYDARFVLNQTFFRVSVSVNERLDSLNPGKSLALLKEILDAYE